MPANQKDSSFSGTYNKVLKVVLASLLKPRSFELGEARTEFPELNTPLNSYCLGRKFDLILLRLIHSDGAEEGEEVHLESERFFE